MATVISILPQQPEEVEVLQQQIAELEIRPRKEAKLDDPSVGAASASATGTVIVVAKMKSKSMSWDKSVAFWLSSVIDFFGQQFVSYVAGLSEKMEKLEYY